MSDSIPEDPVLAHKLKLDALRVRYESEANFNPEFASRLAQESRDMQFVLNFRQLPDYAKPLIIRGMTRINNGVPVPKAMMLYQRELTLAWAKAHHAGKA